MRNLLKQIILYFFICILIFISYSKFILKNDVIKIFGMATFVVLTGSMEPTIQPGEMIIIKETDNYKSNDIITYREDKNFLVTHRIIRVNEEGIVTKGDNNNIEDKEIKKEQILGKVIFQSKLCGFFILYLLKPITLLLIFILLIKDFIFQSLNKGNKKNKEVTNVEGKK